MSQTARTKPNTHCLDSQGVFEVFGLSRGKIVGNCVQFRYYIEGVVLAISLVHRVL
jgi:hypothetical protein